jgi:MFS family permease
VYAFYFFVPGSLATFMYGPTPIAFPGFPQTLTAAYCLHAVSGICSAPIVATTVLMTYITTVELKMKREEVNAPIVSLGAAGPLLGNTLGPLLGAPLVDALGLRATQFICATSYMVLQAAMIVAMWKYRGVIMSSEEEVEPTDKQPADAPAPAKGEDLTTQTHSRRPHHTNTQTTAA